MSKKTAYGLVLRDERLQVLGLRPDSGEFDYCVELCEEASLNELSSGILRELARTGKQQTLLLPVDKTHLLQSQLPPLKERDLRQAMLGLICKYKGMGEGGWTCDYRLRDADAAGQSGERRNYTSLFMEQDHLAGMLAQIAAHSIRPQRATSSALALESLLRSEITKESEPVDGAWNLVYLGTDEIFIVVGDAKGALFFRELPQDLSGGADREEYVKRLSTEIERSNFFARQGEQSVQVKRVYLAGDPALLDPVYEDLDPVVDFETFVWHPERRFNLDGEAPPWTLLLAIAGAVSGLESPVYNLIQRRAEDRPVRKLRGKALLAAGTATLALAPVILAGSYFARLSQESSLRSLGTQLEESRHAARESARDYLMRRSLLARQSRVDKLDAGEEELGDLLRDLATRMPAGVRMRSVTLEHTGRGTYKLSLNGECVGDKSSHAQAQFLSLRAALAESPYLGDARAPSLLKLGADDERRGDSEVLFALEYTVSGGDKG